MYSWTIYSFAYPSSLSELSRRSTSIIYKHNKARGTAVLEMGVVDNQKYRTEVPVYRVTSTCQAVISTWNVHILTTLSEMLPLTVRSYRLQRVKYKVIISTRRCLIGTAPRYLAADCVPVSEMAQRRHLYAPPLVISSSCRLNSCCLRVFTVLGLRLRNSLPRLLRDTGHNTTTLLVSDIL